MLVDHVGYLFFPTHIIFRIIGRLAMPVFAYSVARGYYYSSKKKTVSRYSKNLLIFAISSQIPYTLFIADKLNIGFTWLVSVLLICALEQRSIRHYLLSGLICMLTLVIPLEYGLYGVLFPIVFYYTLIKSNNITYSSVGMALLFLFYVMLHGEQGFIQIFAYLSLYVIVLMKKFDGMFKVNKWFYYVFYPAHIVVLGILNTIL